MKYINTSAEIDTELIAEAETKILDFIDEFRELYESQKLYENFCDDYDEAVCENLNGREVIKKTEQVLENAENLSVQQVIDVLTDTANKVCREAVLFENTVDIACHVESGTVFMEFEYGGRVCGYRNKGDLELQVVGAERDEPERERLPEYDYER